MAPKAETYIGPPTSHVTLANATPTIDAHGIMAIGTTSPCGCTFVFNIHAPTWDRCPLHNHAATPSRLHERIDELGRSVGELKGRVTELAR